MDVTAFIGREVVTLADYDSYNSCYLESTVFGRRSGFIVRSLYTIPLWCTQRRTQVKILSAIFNARGLDYDESYSCFSLPKNEQILWVTRAIDKWSTVTAAIVMSASIRIKTLLFRGFVGLVLRAVTYCEVNDNPLDWDMYVKRQRK